MPRCLISVLKFGCYSLQSKRRFESKFSIRHLKSTILQNAFLQFYHKYVEKILLRNRRDPNLYFPFNKSYKNMYF